MAIKIEFFTYLFIFYSSKDSIAEHAGLLPGDLVIKINEKNVSRATCESLVKIIK